MARSTTPSASTGMPNQARNRRLYALASWTGVRCISTQYTAISPSVRNRTWCSPYSGSTTARNGGSPSAAAYSAVTSSSAPIRWPARATSRRWVAGSVWRGSSTVGGSAIPPTDTAAVIARSVTT
jgi:hypothetical protein